MAVPISDLRGILSSTVPAPCGCGNLIVALQSAGGRYTKWSKHSILVKQVFGSVGDDRCFLVIN